MIFDVITTNSDMSSDQDTGWIEVQTADRNEFNKAAISFGYASVTGSIDGTIDIYTSNDTTGSSPAYNSLAKNFTVNATFADGDLVILEYPFKWLRIVYTKNSITGGTLYGDINTNVTNDRY